MKIRVKCMLLGATLSLAGSGALAFQETKGGTAPSTGQSEKAPLDVRGTGTSIETSPASGIEVRIPGLGKLGVLPKFDFGLELLYGVNDVKGADPVDKLRAPEGEDDTRIRGSLKHRF